VLGWGLNAITFGLQHDNSGYNLLSVFLINTMKEGSLFGLSYWYLGLDEYARTSFIQLH